MPHTARGPYVHFEVCSSFCGRIESRALKQALDPAQFGMACFEPGRAYGPGVTTLTRPTRCRP
jgi:hypothetical protein